MPKPLPPPPPFMLFSHSEDKHRSRCKRSVHEECQAQNRTAGLAAGNPRGRSPLEVVLEATAFSLTSGRVGHFTMEFSTFFFSVVVELWDWASMTPSHSFSSGNQESLKKSTAAPSTSNKMEEKRNPKSHFTCHLRSISQFKISLGISLGQQPI